MSNRFTNPETGETWEAKGRGRPPKWVTDLKKIGKLPSKKVSKPKENKLGDPIAPSGTILSGGTFRVNGKVVYVAEDCELILSDGDTLQHIL